MTTRVLFVCLGNICRSPTAEGIFRAMLRPGDEIDVDSAGTGGWHVGNSPDPRAVAEAARRGIDLSDQRARQVSTEDFRRFDLIIAMDAANLAALRAAAPAGSTAELRTMLSFGSGGDVPDPYYEDGFDGVFDLLEDAASRLLDHLRQTA